MNGETACAACPGGQGKPVIPNDNFSSSDFCVDDGQLEFADWCLRKLADSGYNDGGLTPTGSLLDCEPRSDAIDASWCSPFGFNDDIFGRYCSPNGATLCGEGEEYDLATRACEAGEVGELTDADLCGMFGGDATLAGGQVCAGVDEANTFCLLDAGGAFACRGLLNHVRRCHEFERPAKNAFLCDAKCPDGSAPSGGDCAP